MATKNKMKWLYAALLAGTLTIMGPPARAAEQSIDVRDAFQLEGEAFDEAPTTGESLTVDPATGPTDPDDVDDWGKFQNPPPPTGFDGTDLDPDNKPCANPPGGLAPPPPGAPPPGSRGPAAPARRGCG